MLFLFYLLATVFASSSYTMVTDVVVDLTGDAVKVIPFDDNLEYSYIASLSAQNQHPSYSNSSTFNLQGLIDEMAEISSDEPETEPRTLYKLSSVAEMKKDSRAKLLGNRGNMFHFEKEDQYLYYDYNGEDWYFVNWEGASKQRKSIKAFPYLIPVSACMDSSHGSGGSIVRSYEMSLTITNQVVGSASYNFSNVILGASLGIAVANSLTYTSSYTCDVGEGEYGQMFIQPFYAEVPRSSRRRAFLKKGKGLVADQKSHEELKSFKIMAKEKPNHYCSVVKNPALLRCNVMVGSTHEINWMSLSK